MMPASARRPRESASGPWPRLGALLACLLLAGCSASVNQEVDPEYVWRVADPLPLRVAVTRFADGRPREERELVDSYFKRFDYTNDEMYAGAVRVAISRATAQQLALTRVFEECTYLDVDWSDVHLREQAVAATPAGVDLVVRATVRHFVGWRELNLLRSLLLMPAGIYGTAAGVVLGSDAGAKVELVEVQLLDPRSAEVAWRGECAAGFEEKQRMLATASDNVNGALVQAINGLAKRMYEGLAGLTPAAAPAPAASGNAPASGAPAVR
ncbi:MAG: hypothetical protein HZA54_07900 [Planctomycetes bacterium]|nr:hypothetical protein [Planctomycetota bacterium]